MHEIFFYTYIVASRTHALYIGMTNDLERRVVEHREGKVPGFSAQYRCNRLVSFERYASAGSAIQREKQLKGWRRSKKLALIERENPTWIDLSEEWGRNSCQRLLRLRHKPWNPHLLLPVFCRLPLVLLSALCYNINIQVCSL
jgi:putative endonuclease